MTGRRFFVLLVAGVVLSIAAHAQAPAPKTAPAKTSIIRGRILAADTGRPLRRAQVTLTGPERRTANTGLDGRYEFKELAAGRYTIGASRSGYLALQYGQRRPLEQARPLQLGDAQTIDNTDFTLPRQGLIAGRVLDEAGEPIAGVRVEALRPAWVEGRRQLVIVTSTAGFQGTDDTGEYRLTGLNPGSYYVRAQTRETWTVVNAGKRELMGFSPTFYPATADPGQARLIEVGVGRQIRDADISLALGRPAAIAGIAVDSKGSPLTGRSVSVGQRFLREISGGGGSGVGSAPIAPDGSFRYRNLPPGEYELSVSTGEFGTSGGELARIQVVVNGADLENVRLVTSAGWSASGRVVTEQGAPPPLPRERVTLGATTVLFNAVSGAGAGEVRDDWTFTVKAILGPARLWATLPDGWMVKSVRQNDRDITSSFIERASGEVLSDVEVVITDRVTRVTGQLTDERGVPLSNGTVLVFLDDREKWGDATAFVKTARPDQQGRYEFTGLPAGDYLALAVDYIQDRSWNDPEYLESLRRDAQPFTLGEGATRALSLKILNP